MRIRTGAPSLSKQGMSWRPAVRLEGMLEKNGRSAAVERSEVCKAGEFNEWKGPQLGDEEEAEQESEKEAGGGDLLPEMDRADLLRSGPRLGARLLSTSEWVTWEQKPEETAQGARITMIVRVGDKEQESKGEEHEGRCPTTPLAYPPTIFENLHLSSPHDWPGERRSNQQPADA